MPVRPLESTDIPRWTQLRGELWPEASHEELTAEGPAALAAEPPLTVFVAEESASVVGFLELSLRPYADCCESSPVPYVEGWYVVEGFRGRGIGGALMQAAEDWSRSHGYVELGSDTLADNRLSRDAHRALGFTEVETLVVLRKPL